jgi:hypothetical protein
MKGALDFIWEKTPAYVKWPIVAGLFLIWTPIKLRDEAFNIIDSRVHAIMNPMKEKRDLQIANMEKDIDETKKYTKAMGFYLMGKRRFEKAVADQGEE